MNLAKTVLLGPLLVRSVTAVTMQCSGSTTSNCRGRQCTVTCSDGNKVDLFCEEGGVSISSTNNFEGGKSTVDAQCGKKMKVKACFPFCGSESPSLSPSKVPSTTNSRSQEPELEQVLEPERESELKAELEFELELEEEQQQEEQEKEEEQQQEQQEQEQEQEQEVERVEQVPRGPTSSFQRPSIPN